MADKEIGKITVSEDDDGKAVWEFEGKIQSDIPLDTKAQDFAGAINELKKLSLEGGGDDDNSEPNYVNDPDWEIFSNLPEPASNQVIWGVRIIDISYKKGGSYYENWIFNPDGFGGKGGYDPDRDSEVPCHIFVKPFGDVLIDPNADDMWAPDNRYNPPYHIDWGDGTSSSFAGGTVAETDTAYVGADGWNGGANTSFSHLYSDTGLYIVTLTTEEIVGQPTLDNNSTDNNTGNQYYSNAPQCVFAKIGSGFENTGENKASTPLLTNAGMTSTCKFIQTPIIGMTRGAYTLKYIKATNEKSTIISNTLFQSDYSLEKIEGIDFSKIESIGTSGFQSCASLKELSFENCTSVAASAFRQCTSLKKISLPNCTSIGDNAFYYCNSLEEIDLPNCTSIGNSAFSNCYSLKKINAPKCASIGNSAFSGCNCLKELDFLALTSVGSNPFPYNQNSGIRRISMPLIESINWSMSGSPCLLEVNCPNAASIANGAFQQCRALHTVNFADGCTFGSNCFYECFSLRPRPDGSIV